MPEELNEQEANAGWVAPSEIQVGHTPGTRYERFSQNLQEAQELVGPEIQERIDLSDVLNYLTPEASDVMLADLRADIQSTTPENKIQIQEAWVEDAVEAASRTTGPGGTASHGQLNDRVRKWLEINKASGGNARGLDVK